MNTMEVKEYIENLTSHILFDYNGRSCGVDPLSLTSFDLWYGEKALNVDSVDKVMNTKFFDGKALSEIWENVTDVYF